MIALQLFQPANFLCSAADCAEIVCQNHLCCLFACRRLGVLVQSTFPHKQACSNMASWKQLPAAEKKHWAKVWQDEDQRTGDASRAMVLAAPPVAVAEPAPGTTPRAAGAAMAPPARAVQAAPSQAVGAASWVKFPGFSFIGSKQRQQQVPAVAQQQQQQQQVPAVAEQQQQSAVVEPELHQQQQAGPALGQPSGSLSDVFFDAE